MARKVYQRPVLSILGSLDHLTRPLAPLRRLVPAAQSSAVPSDRNAKEQFAAVDPNLILDRVAALPITVWSEDAHGKPVRHIGPQAEEFAEAFGVHADGQRVSPIDAGGVTLASIQALYQMIRERDAEMAEMRAEINALKNSRTKQ